MKQSAKNKLKGGLLALLVTAGAAKGFTEERVGTVVMKRDGVPNSSGGIMTSVFMDTNVDRIPDTVLYLHNTNKAMVMMLLNEYIQRGSEVLFDDDKIKVEDGMFSIGSDKLISIDGLFVLDLFPTAHPNWFPYAYEKRQREQGRGR
jgi:hypothetical protein